MASVNHVTLLGRLGKDPELRYLPDGTATTSISLATSRTWKDKASGERREETDWHRATFFGRQAEIAGEYLAKGRLVYLDGRLRTRKWTDRDGVERYVTEVVVERMQLLERASGDDAASNGAAARDGAKAASAGKPSAKAIEDMDDDIPF